MGEDKEATNRSRAIERAAWSAHNDLINERVYCDGSIAKAQIRTKRKGGVEAQVTKGLSKAREGR